VAVWSGQTGGSPLIDALTVARPSPSLGRIRKAFLIGITSVWPKKKHLRSASAGLPGLYCPQKGDATKLQSPACLQDAAQNKFFQTEKALPPDSVSANKATRTFLPVTVWRPRANADQSKPFSGSCSLFKRAKIVDTVVLHHILVVNEDERPL
jgi:hypothetical protein